LIKDRSTIGFTAVASTRDFESVEREVLDQMHFKVFGYFITSKKEDKDPEFDERLEETAEQSLLSLIEEERATRPVLVFCSEAALSIIWENL